MDALREGMEKHAAARKKASQFKSKELHEDTAADGKLLINPVGLTLGLPRIKAKAKSAGALAQKANVSTATMEQAAEVRRKAPELLPKVASGELSLPKALKRARGITGEAVPDLEKESKEIISFVRKRIQKADSAVFNRSLKSKLDLLFTQVPM